MTMPAVILAAHGSGDESAANRRVRELAEQVRARASFPQVIPAFHLGHPGYREAIEKVIIDPVIVVPVMTSEGHFADTVLPTRLRESPAFEESRVTLTAPLGALPQIADLCVDLVRATMADHGCRPEETAVIIVGHGTERHLRSRATAEAVCAVLRNKEISAQVEAAFLDEAPRIEDMPTTVSQRCLIAVPFLIGGAYHALRDIPRRLGLSSEGAPPGVTASSIASSSNENVEGRTIVCTAALGDHPKLADLIVDLVQKTAATASATR